MAILSLATCLLCVSYLSSHCLHICGVNDFLLYDSVFPAWTLSDRTVLRIVCGHTSCHMSSFPYSIKVEWTDWGWWCSSGFWHRGDSSVDANVSEKHTDFILIPEQHPHRRKTSNLINRFRAFEDRMLWRIFGPKREGATKWWTDMRSFKYYQGDQPRNMGDMRCMNILVGKSALESVMDLHERGCEVWRAVLNTSFTNWTTISFLTMTLLHWSWVPGESPATVLRCPPWISLVITRH
jgi:hypothetical protein